MTLTDWPGQSCRPQRRRAQWLWRCAEAAVERRTRGVPRHWSPGPGTASCPPRTALATCGSANSIPKSLLYATLILFYTPFLCERRPVSNLFCIRLYTPCAASYRKQPRTYIKYRPKMNSFCFHTFTRNNKKSISRDLWKKFLMQFWSWNSTLKL